MHSHLIRTQDAPKLTIYWELVPHDLISLLFEIGQTIVTPQTQISKINLFGTET